jgi:hypothetical protein
MIKSYKLVILAFFIALFVAVLYFAFQSKLFQTQSNMKLSIPDQTVPLIEIRTSQSDQSFVQLYLCVWEPSSATWFRDDIPICEIQGGPVKVFWNGTKRVFLSPSNPRGSFRIVKQNPLFQVISLPLADSYVPINVADHHELSYFCILEQHQQNKKLRVSFYSSEKTLYPLQHVEIKPLESSISLEPVGHDLSSDQVQFFFSFKKQKEIGSSHGIMQCTINLDAHSSTELKTWYESFYADPAIYYQKTTSDLYRIASNREISIMQSEVLGFLPFTIHRSNFQSFYDYLFKKNHPQSIKAQFGIEIKELVSNDIKIRQYDQIMLIMWKPNNSVLSSSSIDAQEGSSLPVTLFSAIFNGSILGHVQRIGNVLRFYGENHLQQEVNFPDDGFNYEYICP